MPFRLLKEISENPTGSTHVQNVAASSPTPSTSKELEQEKNDREPPTGEAGEMDEQIR